ncbi:hypothetical protein, partial [Pedobacter fastidiosus]|uniref:hypothetical protein n=1 Tax=Pedobacter fastidiosus TaxID=2765361 RepID=UPI001C9B44CF
IDQIFLGNEKKYIPPIIPSKRFYRTIVHSKISIVYWIVSNAGLLNINQIFLGNGNEMCYSTNKTWSRDEIFLKSFRDSVRPMGTFAG